MGMPVVTVISARDRIMGALDKLPPFSPVLTRLLATLADEDVSFGDLAAIVETDAVLAGNLLRVVNSPLYGRIATINSVRHAVAVLSDLVVLETPVPYPEGAFTAGLLHDVGKLLIAVAMPEQFEVLHTASDADGDISTDRELDLIGVAHAEISG